MRKPDTYVPMGFSPYKNSFDDERGHLVSMHGGHARIETGEILEFEIRKY